MNTRYTRKDIGCYIDGAVPRTHVERILVLCDMIADKDPSLLRKLNIPDGKTLLDMEQSESIELDEIDQDLTDALDEVRESGLYWYLEAGDVVLAVEEDSF